MIALATKYDVRVQVASSTVADRLPAMWGRDTLTTVVSSTSMKVLDMTAIAINHGLMSGMGLACVLIVTCVNSNYIRFGLLKVGFNMYFGMLSDAGNTLGNPVLRVLRLRGECIQ
jgi:hypothetical protein